MFDSQSEKIERAKKSLIKRETLLRGELQAEGVRKFLGIEPLAEYPAVRELPGRFLVAEEITRRIVAMTDQHLKEGRERECFIGWSGGNYWLGPIHVGTEEHILDEHRGLFPKDRPDYCLMEIHTHKRTGGDILPLFSPQDIVLLNHYRHIPAILVSSDTGAWFIVKSKEYYELPLQSRRDVKHFVSKSQYNFETGIGVGVAYPAAVEFLYAAILERYGIILYSSNQNYLQTKDFGPRPILDPKQKVEMVKISGETHRKFLAK